MTTCAICLNTVRETRTHSPLRCGHLFHSHCIENWKKSGKQTCPVCRKIFDGSNFKVQLTVHNNIQQTSNVLLVSDAVSLDILDIFFDVDTPLDLDSLLSDFGISMSDLDSSILDTE
jgi:hypothetical protein